jgi:hypothetical protein
MSFKMIRPQEVTAGMLTSSVAEDDGPAYSAVVTYALGNLVISTTTHHVYESLQNGNTGNALPVSPEISTAWWIDRGPTNRWKMFDGSVTSQTSAADEIEVAVVTVGRVDSVALLNISAASAHIVMTDTVAGVVYDETYSLVSDSGIVDYYEYFFEPVTRIPDFAITDMDLYANTTITITLEDEGGTVLCGACVIGLSKTIGETQYGAGLGIQDYSVKVTDDFGNKTLLERAYADTMNLPVVVENASLDLIKKTLASYRATPVVYIGDESYGALIVYGFFRDFSIVISYPTESILNMEIEGLT